MAYWPGGVGSRPGGDPPLTQQPPHPQRNLSDAVHWSTQSSRDRSQWWATLNQLGIAPSKALGQNFLHEMSIVQRIADAAAVTSDDVVVEIGPGLGVLTRELAIRSDRVISIELDHRLAEYVRNLSLPHTNVVEGDVLQTDIPTLTSGHSYVLVANLPYSVASATIAHVLESESPPERLIVMVQREVAERITARPPHMSVLAVAVQFFGSARILFRIGPGAFIPPPKVESAVIRIEVNENVPLSGDERRDFFRLVRAGFSQRRKQVRNSISAALGVEKDVVERVLNKAGIDQRRRAETLDVPDWLRLYDCSRQVLANA